MRRTALITGATSGFGESAAHAFVRAGWRVIATGRRAERLDALVETLGADNVHPAAFDVRDEAAYNRAHLPGAKSLPFEEIEGRLAELYMLPGQPALYDRSGDKTKELAQKMEEQGTPVAFLEGGILAWEAEGLPVERP